MNVRLLKAVPFLVAIVLLLVAVTPLFAASAANFQWTGAILDPDCGGTVGVSFDYFGATAGYELVMEVYGDGNLLNSYYTGAPLSGDGTEVHGWGFAGGPDTYSTCGITHELYIDGEFMGSLVYGDFSSPFFTPWFYTQPSTGSFVTSNHQTVLYNGVEACGVFEAGWYGQKNITPENFPACAGFLPDGVEVACMNEEAVWTADNVTGSGVSEGVFYAGVEQHGTCGIFPAG